jgi:hypothetical protein
MSESILAHFDGERILLDEPFELEPNAKLIIQVLPKGDDEREQWLTLYPKQVCRCVRQWRRRLPA